MELTVYSENHHLVFSCFDIPETEQQREGLSIPTEERLFWTIVWLSLEALKLLLFSSIPGFDG